MRSTIVTVALALLTGCASTSLETVRSPQLTGRHYDRVLVVSHREDIGTMRVNEGAFVTALTEVGASADASGDVLPPTRTYTEEELAGYAIDNGYDAVLLACLKDSYRDYFGEPAASVNSSSGETAKVYGPYPASWPREVFEIQIIDMTTGSVVWRCSSKTKGSGYSNREDMMRSLAEKTADQMRSEGFVGHLD